MRNYWLSYNLSIVFSGIILILISYSCQRDLKPPSVTTGDASEITQTTAVLEGMVIDPGGSPIVERGICWSSNDNPTVLDHKIAITGNLGSFSCQLTKLIPFTLYNVRAYATNLVGTGYGRQVSFSTSPDESNMPYFALPQKGLALMSGQAVTIYGDALVNIHIINSLQVTYNCDIGTQYGNNFTIHPGPDDIGEHELIINFKNNGLQLENIGIIFTVYPKAPGTAKKILLIGDSTMPPDSYGAQIESVLNDTSLIFLGTIGTIYKNEGYPGASWGSFISGTDGKFFKSGSLNIPAYFTDYAIATPDYIYIRLGVNDTFIQCATGGDGLTATEIGNILYSARTLIDAFLAYNPNLKIILGIPTICENKGDGWKANYGENIYSQDLYIENIHKYWISFIKTFANGVYNPRVDCSYEAIYLDRDNGYPKVNGVHTNGIHPDQSGYGELATGIALAINKLLN